MKKPAPQSVKIRRKTRARPASPAQTAGNHDDGHEAMAATARSLLPAFTGEDEDERLRLRKIIDLLPCYVILVDQDRIIRFENKAFQEFFGSGLNEPCFTVLRGLEEACPHCPPLEAVTGKATCVMEWVYPRTSHIFRVYSYPFADMDGKEHVLQVGFNVTSRVRVQQALDLSEQSYKAITDNLAIGIAMLTPNLGVSAGNNRLMEWFGPGFTRGRRICELLRCFGYVPAPGVFCPECPFKAALDDSSSHELEFTTTFVTGKERNVRLMAHPVSPHKSRVKALVLMLEDITTRLKVNQQLQRGRKIEAMATLAGGIAHEINQPLSALHLYASGLQMLLEKKTQLSVDSVQERLSLIMREAEKIRSIIAHMRSLVMQEGAVPLGNVSVARAVTGVLNLMANQIRLRGIKVVVDIPPDLPGVRANDLQLEQVLMNLVANSVHALDSVRGPGAKGPGEKDASGRKESGANAAGKDAGKITEQASEQTSGQTGGQTSGQAGGQTPEQASGRTGGQTSGQAGGQASGQAPEQTSPMPDGPATLRPGERLPPLIAISARSIEHGKKVCIEVADTGPGLPEGAERIFDPFFTTKEAHKGMGLGLSIVHGLVRLWGGEVSARPRHPALGGAAFYLTLEMSDLDHDLVDRSEDFPPARPDDGPDLAPDGGPDPDPAPDQGEDA